MTIQAFGHTWEVRQGTGGPATWNPLKVRKLADGRVRLDLNGGIKNVHQLGYGLYEVDLEGRFDSIPAWGVVAAWLYDDRSDRTGITELDYEISQWNDQNQPKRCQITLYRPDGSVHGKEGFYLGSFDKHRVFLDYGPKRMSVRAEGWWALNGKWKEYANAAWEGEFPLGANLRVGYWGLPALLGASPGLRTVYVTGFAFQPHKF